MTVTDNNVEYDPYALSTGLPDDFTFRIEEAWFDTDARFGDAALLHLKGTTDLDDRPIHEEILSAGPNWDIVENGSRIIRERGKNQFNNRSRAGIFLAGAVESGAVDTMRQRGNPTEAKTWIGLQFHLNLKDFPGYGANNNETRQYLVPTKFLGVAGDAAPSSNGNGSIAPAPALDKVIAAKLTNLAKSCDTHDEFIEQGFALDGVEGNAEAESAVASEAWYTAAREG